MKKQTKSLPRLSVPPPGALAFADGGKLDANQLMADIAAKYGVSGKSEAVPIQPPTPQPQPQPKAQIQHSGGLLQQASDGIRNRFKQADQAGYAQGGKISGPGTAKSDSIPAAVRQTGEQISVSNGERIVSAEQDKFLEGVAIAAGYENLDAMLKDGTGMPVGPTIKAGKRAAADGMAPDTDPDTDRRKTYSPSYGNAFVNRGASTGKPIQDGAIPQFPPALGAGFNGQSTAARGQSVTTPKQPSVTPSGPGVITAESAIGAAEAGMKRSGGVFGTIDMAGVNEILARENKVRSEMADAQRTDNKPGGGVLVIGDGAVTDQDRVNNERTQRWAIDDMASRIKSAGSRSERASLTQAMTTAMNNNVQQRGQDMNFAATISGQGITARGQDLGYGARMAQQGLTARGQDMQAGTAADRIASNESIAAARIAGRSTPTLGQQRTNSEIDAARSRVANMNTAEIKRRTANFTTTGRENPDFDPTLAKAVSLANRRKVGDDPDFDTAAQPVEAQTAAPQIGFTADDVKAAIASGADHAKVAERIRSLGGDPADFGL